ncbi:hypothetical protein HRR83_008410 [Exophiala dermatitidis]|nr:hypothetical protein HRR73_008225 [Exophiala dermatitidis]KAJ4506519.1 hypothetical protein HRR74_008417 [Exophiala dermatitidis]KAJ4533704.1 hypothetical protein HRR77_008456 [Exophiala dermatitidis]KAJ4547364.1 hypothetical protein HRR76_000014 [Exophiala dermatitidis]KAJ4560442.1 hypothetical protein HRR79_008120 [Exophiala dermatitidis]
MMRMLQEWRGKAASSTWHLNLCCYLSVLSYGCFVHNIPRHQKLTTLPYSTSTISCSHIRQLKCLTLAAQNVARPSLEARPVALAARLVHDNYVSTSKGPIGCVSGDEC